MAVGYVRIVSEAPVVTLVVDTSADNDICVVHERSTDKASVVQGNPDARKTSRIGSGSELPLDLESRVRIDLFGCIESFSFSPSARCPFSSRVPLHRR